MAGWDSYGCGYAQPKRLRLSKHQIILLQRLPAPQLSKDTRDDVQRMGDGC